MTVQRLYCFMNDLPLGEVIQRGTHEALAKYQRLAGKG